MSSVSLLVATRNVHKTREIRDLLGESFTVRDLSDRMNVPKTVENGSTFEENAIAKALAVSALTPEFLVMADDSGLEVDLLGGAPGVLSARYAGDNATSQANIEKLLAELREKVGDQPEFGSARFRCVIVLARAGHIIATGQGTVEGSIVDPPRGTKGFGYDPVFQPAGYDKTFGELPSETKNTLSHRFRAIESLRRHLPHGG
jgi:XTP/dITP diphosphohydrolase